MSTPEHDHDEPSSPLLTRLKGDSLILIAAAAFLGTSLLIAAVFGTDSAPPTPTVTALARATIGRVGSSESPPTAITPAATTVGASAPTFSIPTPVTPSDEPYPQPPTQIALAPTTVMLPSPPPPVFAPTLVTPTFEPPTPEPPPTLEPATATLAPTLAPATAAPAPNPPATAVRVAADASRPTPRPTAPPVTLMRGANYWRTGQSPIVVSQDLAIAAGASLIIEPGVEVRLAPGVAISVDGRLYALGRAGQPVRFVPSGTQRWEAIYGRPGSEVLLEQAELRGGGSGGTILASEGGALILRSARVNDNGGHVQVSGGRLEVRDSEIAGNDMPYGAALDASVRGGTVVIVNSRIGGNRLSTGAPQVRIQNESPFDPLAVEIRGNLLVGQDGPNLTLSAGEQPIRGEVSCNALLNGANGLSIRSETPQTPGFPLLIVNNAIDDHMPPVIPIYLKYGIGRGATSEVEVDMRKNWWGSQLGPYEPDRHADGRGDSVGENIAFDPWLPSWPACAPRP